MVKGGVGTQESLTVGHAENQERFVSKVDSSLELGLDIYDDVGFKPREPTGPPPGA